MAVESVAGCAWNGWPDHRGIGGQMLMEWVAGWPWNPQPERKRQNRVGGGVTPAVLPHHRTYGSVYGGSCLLTNSISELGSVDVSPAVAKRPDRPSEFPTPTS